MHLFIITKWQIFLHLFAIFTYLFWIYQSSPFLSSTFCNYVHSHFWSKLSTLEFTGMYIGIILDPIRIDTVYKNFRYGNQSVSPSASHPVIQSASHPVIQSASKWGTRKLLEGCLEPKPPYCTSVKVSYLWFVKTYIQRWQDFSYTKYL